MVLCLSVVPAVVVQQVLAVLLLRCLYHRRLSLEVTRQVVLVSPQVLQVSLAPVAVVASVVPVVPALAQCREALMCCLRLLS